LSSNTIDLFNVHYLPTERPLGGVVRQIVIGTSHELSSRFASMRAYYDVWKYGLYRDVVGFQGYRKHLDLRPGHFPKWSEVSKEAFWAYQDWLVRHGAGTLACLMDDRDILITSAFDMRSQGGMAEDFCQSRSPKDWAKFVDIMDRYGTWDWYQPSVTPHWFVMTARVFNQFMELWWCVFSQLEPLIHSEDAHDGAYPPRAFDYLTERFFTVWLDSRKDLRTRTLPLMICWDAK
jgi:hypothetical protein